MKSLHSAYVDLKELCLWTFKRNVGAKYIQSTYLAILKGAKRHNGISGGTEVVYLSDMFCTFGFTALIDFITRILFL
jgi:hypothetical protein